MTCTADLLTALGMARIISGIVALFLLAVVAERLMPLRSVYRDRWEWELRPAQRFPRIDRDGWLQVLIFAICGFGIGGLFRLLVGIIRPRRLPAVLGCGITQSMTRVTSVIFDSEINSHMYAAAWLRNTRRKAYPQVHSSVPLVMVTRIFRRGYIPILFVVVALIAFAVVPFMGSGGRTLITLSWSILASAVWRTTRLDIPGALPWRIALLTAVAMLGAAVQFLPGVPHHPVSSVLCSIGAIVYCALVRGKPRSTNDFSSMEVGIGAPLQVGLVRYWLSGGIAVIPALACEYWAVLL